MYIVYNILPGNLRNKTIGNNVAELFFLGNDCEDWYTSKDSSRVVEGQTLRSHSNRSRGNLTRAMRDAGAKFCFRMPASGRSE